MDAIRSSSLAQPVPSPLVVRRRGSAVDAPVRVLLAEPWPQLQEELLALEGLGRARVRLVGIAPNYPQALYLAGQVAPEAVVLACFTDGMDVLQALSALQALSRSAVLLHGMDDPARARQALAAGAAAVLAAGAPGRQLLAAILRACGREAGGESAAAAADPVPRLRGAAQLTLRERQLVRAIVTNPGAKYLAIGSQLGISEHTVHNHLSSIYHKLHLINRAGLLLYAVRHGIVAEHELPQ